MKTNRITQINTLIIAISCLLSINVAFAGNSASPKDSIPFTTYQGQLIDKDSEGPIVFATVFVEGTNIGTVTNSDGAFIIKVPKGTKADKLYFTHIGYSDLSVSLSEIAGKDPVISMVAKPTNIDQVTIRSNDPLDLIAMSYNKIGENYKSSPEMQRAFYRETVQKGRNYVAILEAIVDVYKGSYAKELDNDKAKIYKARKSRDVKKMDTVLFKLQGGPAVALMLDVAKNPYNLISPDVREYYKYKLEGVIAVNDKMSYVIGFDQKSEYDYPLYSGKIYLDFESLAITGTEFKISEEKLNEASKLLVRKKPVSMRIETSGANYMANYRVVDGKWYLHYVRAETAFKCKWNRKLFAAEYNTIIEMAITNRTDEGVNRYKNSEAFRQNQVLSDNIYDFEDDDFWGSDNTIRPDESIESAIKRLNRRLK